MQIVGDRGFAMRRWSGSLVALLASVGMHAAGVMLAGHSLSQNSAALRGKEAASPQFFMEARIEPPRLSATSQPPVEPKLAEFEIPFALPTTSAVKLLTPPPIPIEPSSADGAAAPPGFGIESVTYLPTSVLSVRPKATTAPELQLPIGWLEAYGQAILKLYVNADGGVDDAVIVNINFAEELREPVRKAFLAMRFTPGELGGRPVPCVMTIETDISTLTGRGR